jgi:hypothetical protein
MTRFSRTRAVAVAIAILAGAATLSAGQSNNSANQQAADVKEVYDYRLTLDKLSRFEVAAKAVKKVLADSPAAQQKLDADSQNSSGPNSFAQSVAAIDKQPQLTAAIKASGFTTHEYVVITYALMASESYVDMKKDNPNAPMPPYVSPANAAFAEANFARIQALGPVLSGSSN